MELHIAPISRKSSFTEDAFEKNDRVVSLLLRTEPRSKDDKEAQEALKLTADNLFISLFEGEDGPSQENAKFKHLLGLMLERRRLLRVKERDAAFTIYIHRPTKNEYAVPNVELDPQFFIENQEKLEFLSPGSGESESPASKGEAPEVGTPKS